MNESCETISSEHIRQRIEDRFGFVPREKQINALSILLNDEEDVILIARTGFGKSIIFQAAPLMWFPAKTALIIMPLNALEDEQCEKLKDISGCKPFVLNGDSHNSSNIALIRQGSFTHCKPSMYLQISPRTNEPVFTSPEIAISKSFNEEVLKHSSFSANLCLLAIDEIHLVSEWREFRPEYYDLGVLRTRLPAGLPLLGASATLDAPTLEVVKDRCGFNPSANIVKTALDRSEIYIQVSSLEESANSMLDLQHILPARVSSSFDIPKTIIFMDSIKAINNACALMRVWMNQLSYPPEAKQWVASFFSDMASIDKTRLAACFKKPSAECAWPRILIATDAYGLGVDNPDIARVLQWLLPSSMAKLYQRLGRGMRCGRGQAHFTLLHPSWCVGPRSGKNAGSRGNPGQEEAGARPGTRTKSATRSDPDRRRDMEPGQWELLNASVSGDCIRNVGLKFFEDEVHQTSAYIKPQPCCSSCDPNFQTSTARHVELIKNPEKDSLRRPWLTRRLREWRAEKALTMFPSTYAGHCPSLIMPDSIVESLANWAEYIHDELSLRRWIGGGWDGIRKYHIEIVAILKRGHDMSIDTGEVFDEWRRINDVKRKRIPDPDFNDALVDFTNRRRSWLISCGYDQVIDDTADKVGASRKRAKAKNLRAKEKVQPSVINESPEISRSPKSPEWEPEADARTQTGGRQSRKALQEIELDNSMNSSRELPPSNVVGRERKRPARYEG